MARKIRPGNAAFLANMPKGKTYRERSKGVAPESARD